MSEKQVHSEVYKRAELFGVNNINNSNVDSFQINQIYHLARPALVFAKTLTIFNPAVKKVLQALITKLDQQTGVKQ